jgi:hypothetical protein
MKERPADPHFDCTDAERAAFEAGIKLGAAYHQFTGVPVSTANVEAVERAIEGAVGVQPFVKTVRVRIDRTLLKEKRHEFDYCGLTGRMLDLEVVVRYGEATVRAAVRWDEELEYPLMRFTRQKD